MGPLSDRSVEALPAPWRLTLVTNPDDCNLRCVMCAGHSAARPEPHRGPRRRMSLALARLALDGLADHGLRELIPSTMGEPLLWRHLDALLDLLSAHGVRLNLTTNGSWPGLGAAAWAERLVPLASDIKVSWNGASRETSEALMPGLDHEQALRDLRTLARVRDEHEARSDHRCTLTLQVTAQRRNVDELPDIVRLAASFGLDRVKVHHVQAHWPALRPTRLDGDPDGRRRWNAAVAEAHTVAGRVVLQNLRPLCERTGDLPRGPCPFLGREAWVGPRGSFRPCPHPAVVDGALGSFGRLGDATLLELWRGPAYRRLLATWDAQPTCRACPFRRYDTAPS